MPDIVNLREQAKKIYIGSGGKRQLKDIAAELGLPPTTVSSWKKRDQWDAKLTLYKKAKAKAKPGEKVQPPEVKYTKTGKVAQHPAKIGNTNAVGGGPPKGTQNNFKHGLYEQLKYKDFTDEERELIDATAPEDKGDYLRRIIAECEVREIRMYKRLDTLYKAYETQTADGIQADSEMSIMSKSSGRSVLQNKRSVYNAIIATEEALTKLQDKKRVAVDSLHKLERDRRMFTIEERKLELAERRLDQGLGEGVGVTVIIQGEEALED